MSALDEMEERNQHEAYQRGFAEARKQERERIVKILESWNPFQTTFGEVMESLCKQREGAPVTPQQHCDHEPICHLIWQEMMRGWTNCERTCSYDTRTSRPALSPESVCPFWESPIGDHWKGTCQFDFGDCRYPDDPNEWKDCMRKERHDAAITAKAREDTAVELEQMETTAKQRYEFATAKNEEVYQQGIIMGLQMATKSLRREVQE